MTPNNYDHRGFVTVMGWKFYDESITFTYRELEAFKRNTSQFDHYHYQQQGSTKIFRAVETENPSFNALDDSNDYIKFVSTSYRNFIIKTEMQWKS